MDDHAGVDRVLIACITQAGRENRHRFSGVPVAGPNFYFNNLVFLKNSQ